MSNTCLTCKHDSPCSDPQQTPCAFCGEGYMYYEPVVLSDKEEDEVMQKWIEKQRKYAENTNKPLQPSLDIAGVCSRFYLSSY